MSDEELYALLALLQQQEDVRLEPSALAGVPGIARVLSAEQEAYRQRLQISDEALANATHLAWATGGSMVPEKEMADYLARGRKALSA